jgi:hypothetical protein
MAVKSRVNVSSLVLDVLKSHKPGIVELAEDVKKIKGVKTVKVNVSDVDEETEKVKITITGNKLSVMKIRDKIERFGASVHSLDEIVVS